MKRYQKEFLEFAIHSNVLSFGEFTLKSGRVSPYFFNTGLFQSGGDLAKLGRYYAHSIVDSEIPFDMLYGPAYKGIPLVAATSIALAEQHERSVPYAFNRKEAKDHGEGGLIVGAPLKGRVLIVDDVISAGTSTRESVGIIRSAGAEAAGVAISLDRQERGMGETSAVQEVESELGLQVSSIVSLEELITYLGTQDEMVDLLGKVREYQERYGIA